MADRFPGARRQSQALADKADGKDEAPEQDENAPPAGAPPGIADPNTATMEAKGTAAGGVKKVGRWTIDQLRQTDAICILQNGTNRFDSQKGMTKFGTPRNNTTPIKNNVIQELPEEIALLSHAEVRYQSGSNKYDSQKKMTSMGAGRDVVRESVGNKRDPADISPLPEEKALLSEGIVRLQSGTNKFDSQKGMTLIGTNRREVTHMKDEKHPEYQCDQSMDQSEIGGQMGSNKFASQKLTTSFGTNRRELTRMKDSKHPEQDCEHPDQSTVRLQSGSNKFCSQKGMTSFGQGRWETLNPVQPGLDRQERIGQGLVPYQMGSNLYESQKGWTSFGAPRDVKKNMVTGDWYTGDEIPLEQQMEAEKIIRYSSAGWNQGDSQKKMTNFGTPRDVKGKHIKRFWELEFPEEAEAPRI